MMISEAQVTAMSSQMLDQFSQDLYLQLGQELPDWEQTLPADVRRQQVADILRYGRQLRLSDTGDLYRFTSAVIRFGLSIPLPPSLAGEFRSPELSPAAQVENLLLRLISGRDHKIPVAL